MMTTRTAKYCVFTFLLFPAAASADPWQQYTGVMDRYYHIDQQAFSQITCKIEAQPLQSFPAQLRQQLSGMSDKLRVTDTLDKYQLVFDKKTGLSFRDPSVSIDILSEKGMADPVKVKQGISDTVHGFDLQVQGVDTQLKGLFEGYVSTKQSDITVDAVDVTSDGATLKYRKDGSKITDTIHGLAVHSVGILPAMSITVDSSYKVVDGDKQILDNFDMKLDQPMQPISMHASVTYQSFDGIVFPAVIEEHGAIGSAQSVQTSFVITAKLTDCQLRK